MRGTQAYFEKGARRNRAAAAATPRPPPRPSPRLVAVAKNNFSLVQVVGSVVTVLHRGGAIRSMPDMNSDKSTSPHATNQRTNERASERASERTNEQTNLRVWIFSSTVAVDLIKRELLTFASDYYQPH